ncbi:MAG: YgjV family protein [Treponema sp.]|nr:YgjV family protein [Treponema sp.]
MNDNFFDISMVLELIGYTGSALVIISMLMTSIVKLRIINSIGSTIFCGYALCIHSYPTAAMQLCLIAINLISLYKLRFAKKEYTALSVNADDGFLKFFIETNKDDIKKFFPDFKEPVSGQKVFIVTCEKVPAGIFIASEKTPDTLNVELDYTTPSYRDCSAGTFLLSYLKDSGIKKLTAKTDNPAHEKYLHKIGFVTDGDEFIKTL